MKMLQIALATCLLLAIGLGLGALVVRSLPPEAGATAPPKFQATAVHVHLYWSWNGGHSTGYLENTSQDTVQVQAVYQFRGEDTEWIELLAPHQRRSVDGTGIQHGYYIRSADGARLLGWLQPHN